jgi:hypothetical protein
MTDDLIRLCIVLVTASLNLAIFVLICFFIYQVINYEPKKPAARVPLPRPRQRSSQHNLKQAKHRRFLDAVTDSASGSKKSKPPSPPSNAATQPTPLSPVPDSINVEELKQRIASKRKPKAINRGVPYKILRLMHNDTAAADRLFEQVSNLNPDKDERWCWEKVLWDLERDRL